MDVPILVIGSVAVDEVVRLDAPLRPGSHNQGQPAEVRIGGGAANTAMALARAGAHPLVVSAVGRDPQGAGVIERLAAIGVDTTMIAQDAAETTRSLLLLDPKGERTIVNLARARVGIPPGLAEIPAACVYVRSADPALTGPLFRMVRHTPVVAHIPPVIDGLRPAHILVGSASDLDPGLLAAPFKAGRRIAGDWLEWVVITDGPRGATAYGATETICCAAPTVAIVDSTGAGDVFAAGLLYGLATGLGIRDSLAMAVAWGSTSVSYAGTMPPERFPDIDPPKHI